MSRLHLLDGYNKVFPQGCLMNASCEEYFYKEGVIQGGT